jgi:hypothetical protein
LQPLIDDLAERAGAPTVLEDDEQRLIAFSSQSGPVDDIRRESILLRYTRPTVRDWFRQFGIVKATQPLRIPRNPEQGILGRLCVPVDHHGIRVGYLWLIDDAGQLDNEVVEFAVKAARDIGLLIFEDILAERLASGVLEHLLSPAVELRAESARHIGYSGLLAEGGQVVAIVAQPIPLAAGVDRSVIAESLRDVTRRRARGQMCGLVHTDHGVIIERYGPRDPVAGSRRVAEALCNAMSRRMSAAGSCATSVVAGIGDPRPTLSDAYLSYREARLAGRVAATVTTVGQVASWHDLGVFRSLAQLSMCEEVTSNIDPRLTRLLEHADPAVLETVETFLDLAGDVKATAESLHVHRGTLYYRLQKAEQLAEADLRKGLDRLALHLGFKLARLVGIYAGPAEAAQRQGA